MKRRFSIRAAFLTVYLFTAVFGSYSSSGETPLTQSTASGFSVKRGTNISHWLSQSRGEWRCLATPARNDRLQWYSDVRFNLESNGIGWATWDYKGNFGIVDGEGTRDSELIETLLGPLAPE